jgi:ribA/ribD-fused uncharacterized protein
VAENDVRIWRQPCYQGAMADIRDTEQLLAFIAGGGRPEYLMFWGHQPPPGGAGVGRGCLSQWWPVTFTASAEHYMMRAKALLFGDAETAERIVAAPHPGAAKALGREVRGFDEQRWAQRRFEIVVDANMAKFGQHPELREFLLATGDRVIVEASPRDRVWGIGLAADDERAQSPDQWPGLNLLGFALMETRHRLRGAG